MRRLTALAGVLALMQPTAEFTPAPRYPTPPPISYDVSSLRKDPAPDAQYQQDKPCVEGRTRGDVNVRPWGQMGLNFEQAWRFGRGEGQLVAVIDTGVNRHPRLAGRLTGGGDYVTGDDGTTDCDGHGTMVAGIIAADESDRQSGFKGVAPGAGILAIRQSSKAYGGQKNGSSVRAGDQETLARAIVRAADRDAGVINISSVVCMAPGQNWSLVQAAVRYAREQNSVVVAAAGNVTGGAESNCGKPNQPDAVATVPTPAWLDSDVLTVGALNEEGGPASFTLGGPWVDVAAPGTNNTSLDPKQGASGLANRYVDGNQLLGVEGTSFAAPYVSGVVALVRARYPHLDATQVMERIKKTARQPQGRSGRDFHIGYGMVDPVAALTAVLPEEQGINPRPPLRSTVDIAAAPLADQRPLTVALVGTGIALGLLALTHLAVRALRRRATT
ncbi:type VII secretion-associated serine protease mycosin [Allokutzneria sp. A3M-2-11 16]|uniref:type VII secretion-associated serine protease mycosin n=1 Tax=Allokutzneria sp. A3M-2-11 16 TaxID=2962043 RepID=UPI0020B8B2AE|nr:type VII secretion-associated serine protease mycosin [Allokutzneria sp. A3M-2-11 16]MCP3798853.1 type VII secretion-associated serine protease mycosin [Allokutzneria sp. A3M-2-11 16]